jgi:hypothetical protein
MYATQIMEQWQIGPVPDYVYGNNNPGQQPHQPNDMQYVQSSPFLA